MTSTGTSVLVAVRFSPPSTPEKVISRHEEYAAAGISSGLVPCRAAALPATGWSLSARHHASKQKEASLS